VPVLARPVPSGPANGLAGLSEGERGNKDCAEKFEQGLTGIDGRNAQRLVEAMDFFYELSTAVVSMGDPPSRLGS
jgi:hypothetical protein